MRVIPVLLAAALVLVAPLGATAAGNNLRDNTLDVDAPVRSVSLNAMLISASNEKVESDRRLAGYVSNLKSSTRFESFKFIGEGAARIDMPGSAMISLPKGQQVSVEASDYGEGKVWLRVIWKDGGRQFMNVVYAKWPRGKPIVVGGLNKSGENLAIIVTPR